MPHRVVGKKTPSSRPPSRDLDTQPSAIYKRKNPVVPAPEPGPRYATERHLQTKNPVVPDALRAIRDLDTKPNIIDDPTGRQTNCVGRRYVADGIPETI